MCPIRTNLAAALALSLASLVSVGCGDDAVDPLPPSPDAAPTAPHPDAAPDAAPDAQAESPDAPPIPFPDAAPPDAAPDARPAPGDAAPGCSAWSIEKAINSTTHARVHDGLLELRAEGAADSGTICDGFQLEPCDALSLYQGALADGDFEAVAEIDSVEGASGLFSGVSLFTSSGAFSHAGYSQITVSDGGFVVAANSNGFSTTTRTKSFGTEHLTLRIQRVNGKLTLSAEGNGNSLVVPDLAPGGTVYVGLSLDRTGHDTAVTGRVASFHITSGGGAVASDDFDCDGTTILP